MSSHRGDQSTVGDSGSWWPAIITSVVTVPGSAVLAAVLVAARVDMATAFLAVVANAVLSSSWAVAVHAMWYRRASVER